jgi:Skp family chaperone for outer membrane proteins
MKKSLFFVFGFSALLLLSGSGKAQTGFKVGVFDLDIMVQAMPPYRVVDSLMEIFNRDTLGSLREYNEAEYTRLDSTYKADSALVAQGKKNKALLDLVVNDRQKAMVNILYWQQIAQNRSDEKRANLSQNLYQQVSDAYKKVLTRKKYTLVLKPNTYEVGFAIDNIFIAVARELKLTELPQQLLYLGNDPDPKPATTKPATPAKPKT